MPAIAKKRGETKAILTPFEVKQVDAKERTFEGLASTWDLDLGGDVIHRGAFKKTLQEWRASGRIIPLIDQHNYGSVRAVVGKLIDARETSDGLWTKYEVIDGPDGDEILRRIEGGYVDGLSIGYRAIKIEAPTEDEVRRGIWRHLKEVQLREVSVVIWPMNEGARINVDSVKSLLAAMKDHDLDDDVRGALKALRQQIDALLAAGEEPQQGQVDDGLAPDDPKRAEIEARARAIRVRAAATRLTV